MSQKKKEEREKTPHLELRDYVAFVVASLQTTLLPILILIVVLIVLAVLLRL